MRDELQKKESNIDRQTVKKEDNHDHNYCVIEIATPVDCPWVSLVYILNIQPSEWNIGIYCIQGRNISRGRRPRKIFSTEGTIYADISQGRVLNI